MGSYFSRSGHKSNGKTRSVTNSSDLRRCESPNSGLIFCVVIAKLLWTWLQARNWINGRLFFSFFPRLLDRGCLLERGVLYKFNIVGKGGVIQEAFIWEWASIRSFVVWTSFQYNNCYLYVLSCHVQRISLTIVLNNGCHDIWGSVQVSPKDQWVIDVLSGQQWEFPDERTGVGTTGKVSRLMRVYTSEVNNKTNAKTAL